MKKDTGSLHDCYRTAQHAISDLKAAVLQLLEASGKPGLTNAQIGRTLGIYQGHVGHKGHIPRTLLSIMASEGVVSQDQSTKRWHVRSDQKDNGTAE